jgi:hypothetical protein
MSQPDKIVEINNQIQIINNLINHIESEIKFKADINKYNEITEEKNIIIKNFIKKVDEINNIFSNTSDNIYDDKSDNGLLIGQYLKLINQLKFKTTQLNDERNNKILYINKLNYTNLSNPITNLYLINILGKLLVTNICFKFFKKITSHYEGWMTFSEQINSEIIFNKFLNNLFSENPNVYYLVIKMNNNLISCLKFDMKIIKKNKEISINKNEKININTINKIEFYLDNKLLFEIIIDYRLFENKKDVSSWDKEKGFYYEEIIYDSCVKKTGEKKYDSEILGNNNPSNFIMKFNIKNNQNNIFNDNIIFNINYYKCRFQTFGYDKVHFRYEFILNINGNEYFMSPYDKINNFDNLIVE